MTFRGVVWISGWVFHPDISVAGLQLQAPDGTIVELDGYGIPSPDVVDHHGEAAANSRFRCRLLMDDSDSVMDSRIYAVLSDGTRHELEDHRQRRMDADLYHRLNSRFSEELKALPGGRVLEIGSRDRSGVVRRGLVPSHLEYLGLDIMPGDNVDIVADVHELTKAVPAHSVEAVLGYSVFEHLLMPWKAVIEINHVLKMGGLVMLTTHQTWPVHEAPWDFWRYSDSAWHALFNRFTGFEVVETALGSPACVVAQTLLPSTLNLDRQPAYLGSAVLTRKVSACPLSWDVDLGSVIQTSYPQ